ncbi:C-type lectin domain family 4 member E [Phyllostomus discolor]|uniref:C-type lectin domain family 4 member E n=1 Tax=Phyllostomus discolor TaxID=89673 RepID=A0A6J2NGJ5_9CHIR|nr:C-type lectin domain family 4 member E [Phyllostomus discolor]KAF6118035.1 C-type lectin domain family 4 member E [Phyllostomus discolor]
MGLPKSSASQCTERGCFSSPVMLWTVAGISILLLSACFITRCVVTYHIFQLCEEKRVQPHEEFLEFSCYNNGSGSVKNCCPSRWVHFQSSCYFFSTNTMTWSSSVKNCSNMGGHLVVINTQEEQEFLFHEKPKKREFYIGLTDQVTDGQWKWIDGTPFMKSLSFWDVGEPNNLVTVEDCVTIRDSSNPRQNWNDVPCFFNLFRICEMPGKIL